MGICIGRNRSATADHLAGDGAGLKALANYGVIISDVVPEALRKPPAFASEILWSRWTEEAPTICPMWRSICSLAMQERKIHFEVVRGAMQMGFDITLKEHPHEMDQVSSLADPEKNLVPQLGFWRWKLTRISLR